MCEGIVEKVKLPNKGMRRIFLRESETVRSSLVTEIKWNIRLVMK